MTQSRLATVAASLDTTIQPFDQLFGRPTCLLRCTSDCGPERDRSDVAVVFATQWTTESIDTALVLPDGQDLLIAAVANANPRTIVVLETGGPVLMPWAPKVPFGHGLSYSTFSASDLVAKVNGLGIDVSLTWKNTGSVWGRDVAQVYAARAGWESNKRLVWNDFLGSCCERARVASGGHPRGESPALGPALTEPEAPPIRFSARAASGGAAVRPKGRPPRRRLREARAQQERCDSRSPLFRRGRGRTIDRPWSLPSRRRSPGRCPHCPNRSTALRH